MMRSPKSFVVAVRRPDQSIAVREQQWAALVPFLRFLRWPLFRGALVLLESLHNGFSALKFSAEYAIVPAEKEPGRGSSELPLGLMLPIVTLAMVGLFIAAPRPVAYVLARSLGPALCTPWV